MKTQNKIVVLFLLCFIFLYSCDQKEIFYQFHIVDNQKWNENKHFVFNVDSSLIETGVPYTLTWELVHSSNYPYRNIWIYVQNNLENEFSPKNEALQYMIGDEYGKWYGSGFGSLYQLPMIYKEKYIFNEKRNYRFEVKHGMRDEYLIGIDKIGLRIEKSE